MTQVKVRWLWRLVWMLQKVSLIWTNHIWKRTGLFNEERCLRLICSGTSLHNDVFTSTPHTIRNARSCPRWAQLVVNDFYILFALCVVGLPSQRHSLNAPCEFNEKLSVRETFLWLSNLLLFLQLRRSRFPSTHTHARTHTFSRETCCRVWRFIPTCRASWFSSSPLCCCEPQVCCWYCLLLCKQLDDSTLLPAVFHLVLVHLRPLMSLRHWRTHFSSHC